MHNAVRIARCRTGDLGIGGIDEEFGATGARGGGLPAIPLDTKLQLTLAAINTLFRLLHTIQDLAKTVWAVGGPALVNRIVLLASRMKDSFEEAATKILVVFFSHRHIQDAVREAGMWCPTSGQPETMALCAYPAIHVRWSGPVRYIDVRTSYLLSISPADVVPRAHLLCFVALA